MGFQRYNGKDANRNKDKKAPKDLLESKSILTKKTKIATGKKSSK